ncbi:MULTISPECIES: hypothetical protein [Cellulomonas]|uniref:Uncharacterized protein n=1 Tax=Cellulomonas iranensis TaxID=76862 RepID=A0ABU0GM90_9CELL|nr:MULTISPECIES: hypothetical protein [Cellulomonas]MDQ0425707.1 hypothetical protein [Cellulomonas iranensis]TFH72021.1 hypothetical protein E4A51_07815 [Cellulomonas sp. HD19AZ1]
MSVPTSPDEPLDDEAAARTDGTPDPVVATAPTADPAPDEREDADPAEAAPGFPPAPGGMHGAPTTVPPHRTV